jgi:hypothetical protein
MLYIHEIITGLLLCACTSSALGAITSGKLRDEPKVNSAFVIATQPALVKVYERANQRLAELTNKGPQALAAFRELETDSKQPLKSVDILVTKAMMKIIDPQGEHRHVIDFSVIPGLEWIKPLIQYTYEEESGEKFYEKANRELRRGPLSEEVANWTETMRVALGRLPRFVGISFRGARLSEERIARFTLWEGKPSILASFRLRCRLRSPSNSRSFTMIAKRENSNLMAK